MLIKLEQSMQELKALESDITELGDSIGADALKNDIDALEARVNSAGLNPSTALIVCRTCIVVSVMIIITSYFLFLGGQDTAPCILSPLSFQLAGLCCSRS